MKIYSKVISDDDFKKFHGKHFDENHYIHLIKNNDDGYYLDENENKTVLFKFRKKVINENYMEAAINSFLKESKKKHGNRGMASGIPDGQKNARSLTATGQSEGIYSSSNISGYFDRPLREHRGKLGTIIACRTTAFTLKNQELWQSALPFIQRCSQLYKKLGGKYYAKQLDEYNKIKLKIPGTVFTTVTSNYNWRTACHCDAGDFKGGLGNLCVVGKDFTGGYLGFPQFKVLIKIEPGDFLLMDVHQWHCNTPVVTKGVGFRLSFVMYIREDMSKCKKVKMVNGVRYLV